MEFDVARWRGPVLPLSPEELADHHAVGQLCKIYALGMDLRNYDLARSAFADEAKIQGKAGLEPVDESLPATYAVASSFKATQHVIANQYVALDGNEATVWSYGVAHHKVAKGEERDEIIAGVQYRDTCRRYPDGWLIVERAIANQWVDMQPRVSKI
ncbi:SnoaL-like protein [Novosphingobium sp. PhB165]|uniref:nuclear transport factor 2 family protein n=1 Tax=Novosphingobium sp. PhB165 TaxID=2485105 RepID=UPI00104B4E0A|nr:nuclear transport factor 2 family protein [Novosphingobium sp. PhB165]TCM12740.1 SnoaL-like protein [Novosphingobium sp. PhB165]